MADPAPRRAAARRHGWWAPLTPLGVGVAVLAAGAAVAGLALAWQELVVLGVTGLVLVAAAVAWVYRPGAPEVDVAVHPLRLVVGGTSGVADLEVRAGGLPLLGARLELDLDGARTRVGVPPLPPRGRTRLQVEVPARARGVRRVGPACYVKDDVLGLARRDLVASSSVSVLVRPRTVDVALFAGGLSNDLEGATSSRLSMSDLAFHALREYQPGDDLRHVHWRSSARSDRLQVRQYHTSQQGHLTVLLDHEHGSYAGVDDFELAVSIACSMAVRAVRGGLEVYLRCDDVVVSARSAGPLLDAACRFTTGDRAFPAVVAAAATATGAATGMVVQVTGVRRSPGALDAAGLAFRGDLERLVLVAGAATGPSETGLLRVASLDQLVAVLGRVRR